MRQTLLTVWHELPRLFSSCFFLTPVLKQNNFILNPLAYIAQVVP